jgi:lipopolysaccharide transport system permease protein
MTSLGAEFPAAEEPAADDEFVIRPARRGIGIDFSELFRYRELLLFLTWRDLKVRYKQTALGFGWAVLQPLVSLFAFSLIFGGFAHMPSDGLPYPVFAFAGLLPWMFFQNGVVLGGQSLVNQQHVITKVYFPRLFVPAASVGVGLIDLGISLILFAIVAVVSRTHLSWHLVLLPIPLLLVIGFTLGVTCYVAALTVTYRDLRYAVPFVMQFWMYLSPVIYSAHIFPGRWKWILFLNPMSGIIGAFRACISGQSFQMESLLIAVAGTAAVLILGLRSFARMERRFADIA